MMNKNDNDKIIVLEISESSAGDAGEKLVDTLSKLSKKKEDLKKGIRGLSVKINELPESRCGKFFETQKRLRHELKDVCKRIKIVCR